MKNKVWEIKNLVYEFKSRLHIAKDREIREALKKNIQCETKREKEGRGGGGEQSIQFLEKFQCIICVIGIQEETEIVKETMTENMPNIKPYIKKFNKHNRR